MVKKQKKDKKDKKRRKRKNKYIPHLAEFFFKPDDDWSIMDAKKLYFSQIHPKNEKIEFKDCISGMKKQKNNSIDLIIADPPFGINFSGKEKIYNRDASNVIEDYHEISENYKKFSDDWISEIPRIMKDSASAYIFSGYTNLKEILIAIDKANLILKNHIIWQYQFGVFTRKKFVTSHYHILFVVKNEKHYYFNRISHYNKDIWEISRTYRRGQKKNGTKLPVELVQKCIDFSSKPGDLIFDPFMGNATTAIAAKLNFRHYMGYEINDKMRPIIDHNIQTVKLGENYRSYANRLDNPEKLSKINKSYSKAYNHYLKSKSESK